MPLVQVIFVTLVFSSLQVNFSPDWLPEVNTIYEYITQPQTALYSGVK
jgi:hypothetical protein